MAPRQRITPVQEELASTTASAAKPLLQTSTALSYAAEIEIARENHDLFNLVALVRSIKAPNSRKQREEHAVSLSCANSFTRPSVHSSLS